MIWEFSITRDIKQIPQSEWDRIFGDPAEGYGYHKTLQESQLKEFEFYYLIGRRDNNITAIFPFFTTDFSFTTLIQGPLQKIIFGIQSKFSRFLKFKLLFIGSPTTEEFYLGVRADEDLNTAVSGAIKKLAGFAKNKKIMTCLFYNLKKEHRALAEALKANGFFPMEDYPNTLIDLNGSASLEDYTSRLSANTRKDLKRKLKKSGGLTKLTTETKNELAENEKEIYSLYLNNFLGSEVQFEILTPEFFRNIFNNMPQNAKLFITRDKNKIVAFNLCIIKNGLCIDKFIGFDPAVSHQYHLYYATFCHNIDWCIKNNIRQYQMGITDYHPKLRLGAKLIPLTNYVRVFNPWLNFFLRPALKIVEPKNFDPTLRKVLSKHYAGVIPAKS